MGTTFQDFLRGSKDIEEEDPPYIPPIEDAYLPMRKGYPLPMRAPIQNEATLDPSLEDDSVLDGLKALLGSSQMAFGMTGGVGFPKLPGGRPATPAQPWVNERWDKIDPEATLGRLNQMDNITEGWSGGSTSPNWLGELPSHVLDELAKLATKGGSKPYMENGAEWNAAFQSLIPNITRPMTRGDLPWNKHPTQLNSIAPLLAFLMGGQSEPPRQGSW